MNGLFELTFQVAKFYRGCSYVYFQAVNRRQWFGCTYCNVVKTELKTVIGTVKVYCNFLGKLRNSSKGSFINYVLVGGGGIPKDNLLHRPLLIKRNVTLFISRDLKIARFLVLKYHEISRIQNLLFQSLIRANLGTTLNALHFTTL